MILWLLPEGIYKVTIKAWADELEGGNRITEWLRLEDISWDCLVQPPAQARLAKPCYLRLCPVEFWIPPWTCSSVWSSLRRKKYLLAFTWNFNLLPLPFCCHWIFLIRVWLLLHSFPSGIYIHGQDHPKPSVFQAGITPLSISPHVKGFATP